MDKQVTPPRTRVIRDYSTQDFLLPQNRSRDVPDRQRARTKMEQEKETDIHREMDFGPTRQSLASQNASARMADFFSTEVFQIILQNPTTAFQLKKFSEQRLCGDSMDFLEMVHAYHASIDQVTKRVFDIHKSFISTNSSRQINLPGDVFVQINKNLKSLLGYTVPSMENIFIPAQNSVEDRIAREVYPAFVRHQLTVSATKALARNSTRYAGLGDCFVLTNPAKADNPIVFVSDGFAKVTGYSRQEIIPRNCRFLQTRHTDREAVTRIRSAIDNQRESVELLLNERKDGEPFWNLLYITPLFDQAGRIVFFLGGQINLSTAIHNTSDILRTLSASDDVEEETPITKPKSRWRPFRKSVSTAKVPGMESNLVDDMSNLSFNAQKSAFYSAYSKFFVIDSSTMKIAFHSTGMMDLLNPGHVHHFQLVGFDVFKVLAQYTPVSVSSSYTSQVKLAIKSGQATSIDLFLSTQRMGSEKFATHWTPLKDERGDVGYIVLTIGSIHDV